ncbi:allantoicase [Silvimonas iriomotensis]|uniref:Probable allantoicase n=1 Tax=Silvimonas iriomotensis TaxID=449662 RepID=A0ABQ2PE41_9NEIS|nr:allantoicase [Silvimonas iriomotensis]GGP23430.1 putative allantoicase 1 [Silvimonas iriomotensis]
MTTDTALPTWTKTTINLADPRLGALAITASDEFFAPLSRMLNPEPAVFIPGKYDENGKWMDGWETRRKRSMGHDWSIIKLGRKGVIAGFDVDTSHFTGNYAPAVSIEATDSLSDDPAALASATWTEVLVSTSLSGNSHHFLPATDTTAYTHLRIHIYPDGGIARLRVYGQPIGAFDEPGKVYDLAALENGGRAVAFNDAHFGAASNLLLPGRGVNMGDGWETRRRREPGNDWCIIALGAPGIVERIEVDTAHFKGNYPDRCMIQAARMDGGTDQSIITQSMFWPVLLDERKLQMDAIHTFSDGIAALGPVTHVRLNIIPDGGVSRLRIWGKVAR